MTSTRKRTDGCWTCRVRRKRCDEARPTCQVCKTLHIDCVYSEVKPQWMDGGKRQKERMETIKTQVKGNASQRRERQVLNSMDEPFIITSENDFRAPVQRSNEVPQQSQGSAAMNSADLSDDERDEDEPMTNHEPHACSEQAAWPASDAPSSDGSNSRSPLSTLIDTGSNAGQTIHLAKPEALSFPASNQELADLNLGRETETEFLMMYLDYVFPFLYPFYRPPMMESGRHWLLNLLRCNQVAFHTAVSLGSYFFTIALNDTLGPQDRSKCTSLLWGQLSRQTSLALKRIQEDMGDIALRGAGGNLTESARVVGSIVQQILVEVAIKGSADWNLHLKPTVALFDDIFNHHGKPAGYPDLVHLLKGMPDPPMAMVGDNPLPHTADRNAFTFFTTVLLYIDIIASTSLDQPPQLSSYQGSLLSRHPTESQIRLESVFGVQNFVFLALKATSTLSAWKKSAKSAGTLSVIDLVQRATAISADLEAGLADLDAGSAASEAPIGVSLGGHFKGYYRRLEDRRQDQREIATATRIWAHAAKVYLAVVVSGWQPGSAGIRSDVAVALDLLGRVEEPGKIRSFAWPLCVVGCMAAVGQEQDVRDVVTKMGELREFGTVGQVLRIVEAVWGVRMGVDCDSWDVAACLNVLGSPALLL